MTRARPKNIDEYIAGFPEHVQKMLQQVRAIIKKTVPKAEETISYGIPSFTLDGRYLLYFAGYKKHIGVYPVPVGNAEFEREFSLYKTSGKGAIQFPLDRPIPLDLISKIARFRAKVKAEKVKAKKK
jgi:uncharacterized protein YdhG (YjbR/CyaY superfamily)